MAGRNYKTMLLGLLLLSLVFNKVEHAALGVMLEDIKSDLALSDTQLGLLTGIAFTLFYATMGVPLARWADRGDRVTIISVTTALQCGALALSSFAGNFLQLLLFRVGVAVGEAGCVAPANSLIASHFERAERARATSWFMLGYPASAVAGYVLGGWLNELVGWRMTFLLMGIPGVLLALLIRSVLRDPRRRKETASASSAREAASPATPSLRVVAATLWASASYRHLVLGYALLTFFGIGVVMWLPTFFIRSHGFQTSELGLWLALIWGVGGTLGTYVAGELATRRAANNESLQVKAIAATFALSGLCAAGIYVSPDPYIAFTLLIGIAVVNYGTAGPLFATIQTLVPESMRAVAVANTYLFTNLLGVGLGPLAVGAMSDALQPRFAEDSLRIALLVLCPGYLWAAWHLWRATRTLAAEIQDLPASPAAPSA